MDTYRRTKRFGLWMLLLAVLIRLTGSGLPRTVAAHLPDGDLIPFLIYLETGRDVRFSSYEPVSGVHFRESSPPAVVEPVLPVFGMEDARLVELSYFCSLRPDISQLLTAQLDWDLTGQEPSVLILHTHTTESYTPDGENYVETSRYRTLDPRYNMLSIGDAVAEILTDNGIGVIHDRQFHDYPNYNGAYTHARKSLKTILEENPSIRLVLDLHRDASGDSGKQLRTHTVVAGQTIAQLMLVMGTGSSGQSHPEWEENLTLGLKLQIQLERLAPGITRPLQLRSQRFNQDLSAGALLVEVGAAGNTHGEALAAARLLAEAILSLASGTGEPDG